MHTHAFVFLGQLCVVRLIRIAFECHFGVILMLTVLPLLLTNVQLADDLHLCGQMSISMAGHVCTHFQLRNLVS